MNMGAFQDFVRGLAASSDRLPQAMQVRWQRQQAEKAEAQAEKDRQRQAILQRLGLFIQAAQGGANVSPSPEVERLLGESLQRPTERQAPWNEVFRPKQEYINTPAGTFLKTPDGLRFMEDTARKGRKVVLRNGRGYAVADLDDPSTLEGLTAPESGDLSNLDARNDYTNDRSFNAIVNKAQMDVGKGLILQSEALATITGSAERLGIDSTKLDSGVKQIGEAISRIPLSADEKKQLAGYAALETMGKRLLEKLDDPKVQAGLGRLPGMMNSLAAAITGKDPRLITPELISFWTEFGVDKDTIMRVWSGAQTSEQEASRIAGILGGNWDSPGALKISIGELVVNSRDRRDAIFQTAARIQAGDYGDTSRKGTRIDFDLMDLADVKEMASKETGDGPATKYLREKGE